MHSNRRRAPPAPVRFGRTAADIFRVPHGRRAAPVSKAVLGTRVESGDACYSSCPGTRGHLIHGSPQGGESSSPTVMGRVSRKEQASCLDTRSRLAHPPPDRTLGPSTAETAWRSLNQYFCCDASLPRSFDVLRAVVVRFRQREDDSAARPVITGEASARTASRPTPR